MKRTLGYIFFYGGFAIVVLCWMLRNHQSVPVTGHISTWVAGTALGFLLILLGIVLSGGKRRR